jgi:flagellar biosynthesis protein FlhF
MVEDQMPEIVVQRSRIAQPASTALHAVGAHSHDASRASRDELPDDDRAALLQGLMGGTGSILQERRNESISRKTVTPPTPPTELHTSQNADDDNFEPATFRTLNALEVEEIEVNEDEVVQESFEAPVVEVRENPMIEPKPLMPHGNESVFEMAMTPFEDPATYTPKVPAEIVAHQKAKKESPEIIEQIPASTQEQSTPETQALQAQIETLQKMMGQVLDTTRRTAVAVNKTNPEGTLPPVEMSAPLHGFYTSMIDNDVSIDLADQFVGAVRDRLDADELDDATVVRHALLREIESSIDTVSESLLTTSTSGDKPKGNRPHVLALIGPTGVGKTTTVAKLAATAKLRHGKKVALITSDTYRIAAIEQLKTYASIIGLEIRIANSPEEMSQQILSLGDMDLVVIDTAGRSQNNHARLDELGQLINAAEPDETHLVLSSTVGDNVLRKTAERFMALGPDRCILTKIDEAVTTGMIAGMGSRIGLPLSFVTVGQEVPDDILPARADRLARAVLDGPEAVVPSL